MGDLGKFIEKLLGLIQSIRTIGSKVIPEKTLNQLKENLKHDIFVNYVNTGEQSITGPLIIWCLAIYDFTILKQKVEPLEENA